MNRTNSVTTKQSETKKTINLAELKEGMKFSTPVFFEGDNLFVESGLPVRERDIRKLKNLGIEKVSTSGRLIEQTGEAVKEHAPLHVFYMKDENTRCFKHSTHLR